MAQRTIAGDRKRHTGSSDRPLKCSKCPWTFRDKASLVNHAAVHSLERPFQCSKCDSSFKTNPSLRLHIRGVHDGVKPMPKNFVYVCAQCQANFLTKQSLSLHILSKHTCEQPFGCARCGKRFICGEALHGHLERFHKTGARVFKCRVCERDFARHCYRRTHERVTHGIIPTVRSKWDTNASLYDDTLHLLRCCVCHYVCSTRQRLTKHIEHRHAVPSYKCKLCAATFPSTVLRTKHIRLEHFPASYKCSWCPDLSFKGKSVLLFHLSGHNRQRHYQCKDCGRQFRGHSALRNHRLGAWGGCVGRRYTCCHCLLNFDRRMTIISHLRRHRRLHQTCCNVCFAKFSTSADLAAHRFGHFHSSKIKCAQCAAVFETRTALITHLSAHSKRRPHKCKHCYLRFKCKQTLKVHEMRVHRQKQASGYVCPVCLRNFATAEAIRVHARTGHSDERPFKCDKCKACFKAKRHLQNHSRDRHSVQPRCLSCNQCPYKCSQVGALNAHIKRVHLKEYPFKCSRCPRCFTNRKELTAHLKRAHLDPSVGVKTTTKFVCRKHCNVAFASVYELMQHRRSLSSTEFRPYVCSACKHRYACKDRLYAHIIKHVL